MQEPCTGSADQQFTVTSTDSGYLQFVSGATTSSERACLDVESGATADHTPVVVAPCDASSPSQQLTVKTSGSSAWLVYRHSGKCVDVAAQKKSDGARAIEFPCHDGSNQKFVLTTPVNPQPTATSTAAPSTSTSTPSSPATTAPAASPTRVTGTDISASVLANKNVTLSGDSIVSVPSGQHTYTGVIKGTGTLRVRGTGTLILTKDSTFTLPTSRQHQRVINSGGNWPHITVTNPDEPAVIVEKTATLQYGDSTGTTGVIGVYPYATPGYALNQDNIQVDGTLRLATKNRAVNLGTFSGSGLITQPRFLWGGADMSGVNPGFTGVIDNGTGMDFGKGYYPFAIPNARAVLNQGSVSINAPGGMPTLITQNFYEREYGSDINVWGEAILAGQYSYTDQGGDTHPTLSDPDLNWTPVAKKVNKRGTNIEGGHVTWGDGTTNKIFMPGTAETVYINLHTKGSHRGSITFNYNGPVTLAAPIGGGKYHNTLAAPGAGDVIIKGTKGNDVTFAAQQYYDGATTIEASATLRLGSGADGGDASLYRNGSAYQLIDNGALIAQNKTTALKLSDISGSGSFTQAGAATTTLSGNLTYTGPTTITKGTLALSKATLASSSAVHLNTSHAVLDLSQAGNSKLKQLTTVKGAQIRVATGASITVAGTQKANLTDNSSTTVAGIAFTVHSSNGITVLTAS